MKDEQQPSPPTRLRGRPRNPEVEQAVLNATLEELATSGYTGMSMDGIAARAGVSKPAIYRRWPNKPALAIAALGILVASEPPLTGELLADLAAQLEWAHRNLEVSGGVPLIGTILAEMERHPGFLEAYRTMLMRPRRATLRMLLEQGRADGLIRDDLDLDLATLGLLGSILIRDLAGESFPAGWARPVVEMMLTGMGPAPVDPKLSETKA